jgi:hypothetical protein
LADTGRQANFVKMTKLKNQRNRTMAEFRKFPVGTDDEEFVLIPVDDNGGPIRTSPEWWDMIALAMAKNPWDRTPAENNALRKEGIRQ